MEQFKQFSNHVFPSDPTKGNIGSIDLNIWLAHIVGVPILGLKRESFSLKVIFLIYGIILTSCITFFYTGFELYDLVLNLKNVDDLTQNACLSLTHVGGVLKTINTYYRLSDIRKAIEKLKLITKKFVLSDLQRDAFMSGEFENKILLTIYESLVGFTGLLGIAMLIYLYPDDDVGEIFPYRVQLPEWLPIEMKFAYIGISVLILALQIVAIDYLNISMINQIRYQYNVLNLTFDELMLDGQDNFRYGKPMFGNPVERLNTIIEHHCILMELRNEVELIFRIPVLIQFFTSLMIFAMTGFQATVSSDGAQSQSSVVLYFYCGCIFCELFIYCWFGNDVFEQSKTLSTIAYSSSWYEFDTRFKKSLLIFMTNAQRPFLFTAGGFMGLSLTSFSGILQKSYTYIAVLRQFYAR